MPTFPPSGFAEPLPGVPTSPGGASMGAGFPSAGAPGTFARAVNAGALPQFVTLFLPEERPIPGATIFNVIGQQSTAAIQSNVAIPGVLVDVPAGYRCRLDSLVCYVDNLLQTSQLTFSVLANGGPIPGLANIGIFPGVVARAAENFDIFVRVDGPTKLTVQFSNADGGTYLVGAALSGWTWPDSLGKQYMQQGQAI